MRNITPWLLAVPSLFFMAWGGNHFTPLLPLYGEVAELIPWQTNFLLGTYVIGLAPGLLIAAAMSDVYGRKPITLAGLVSSAIGNLIILLGPTSLGITYTGRFFAGQIGRASCRERVENSVGSGTSKRQATAKRLAR